MKLFVDTGSLKDITAMHDLGIIDGVTTNPSLMAKEGGDPRQILKQICQLVQGPVSGEVVSTDAQGMIREGRELAALDKHVVVKVPFTQEGVKACKVLSGAGIPVNVTLIFTPAQALFAAKVGASYVSPFVGRLDDSPPMACMSSRRSSRSSTTSSSAPRCSSPACVIRFTS